jgi:hypothetical protein
MQNATRDHFGRVVGFAGLSHPNYKPTIVVGVLKPAYRLQIGYHCPTEKPGTYGDPRRFMSTLILSLMGIGTLSASIRDPKLFAK